MTEYHNHREPGEFGEGATVRTTRKTGEPTAQELEIIDMLRIGAVKVVPADWAEDTPPPSSHVPPIRWATVRVEDTCDGLLINADDMKRFGLQYDVHYEGHFLPDGRYRIAIPSPSPEKRAALQAIEPEDEETMRQQKIKERRINIREGYGD